MNKLSRRVATSSVGFSLMELVVVLALLGILMAVGVPNLSRWSAGLRLQLAASEVMGTLRFTRSVAVRQQLQVAVKFYPDSPSGRVHYGLFYDGDGDGVRNADIRKGVDPQLGSFRNLEHLVQERDVTISEVDRRTSSRREVMRGTNRSGDDQVVDDFTVDFRDHLIGHQVGEGGLGIDVVHGLQVLCGFQRPGGLQLTCYGADRVTVNRQGDLGLEWVIFQVELIISPYQGIARNRAGGQSDRDRASAMVESRGTCGAGIDRGVSQTAVRVRADENGLGITVRVERDMHTRHGLFTAVHVGLEDVDHDRTGQNWLVDQRTGDGRTTERPLSLT